MTEEEAIDFLKKEFAKYTNKYPKVCVQVQDYIRTHYNQNVALAECVSKMNELDDYVNFLFFEEIKKKV